MTSTTITAKRSSLPDLFLVLCIPLRGQPLEGFGDICVVEGEDEEKKEAVDRQNLF